MVFSALAPLPAAQNPDGTNTKKDKKQPADADRPVVGCGRPYGRRPLQRQKQGDASRRQRIAESADHSGRSRNRCHSGSEGCFLSCRGCRRTAGFRRPGAATNLCFPVARTPARRRATLFRYSRGGSSTNSPNRRTKSRSPSTHPAAAAPPRKTNPIRINSFEGFAGLSGTDAGCTTA